MEPAIIASSVHVRHDRGSTTPRTSRTATEGSCAPSGVRGPRQRRDPRTVRRAATQAIAMSARTRTTSAASRPPPPSGRTRP